MSGRDTWMARLSLSVSVMLAVWIVMVLIAVDPILKRPAQATPPAPLKQEQGRESDQPPPPLVLPAPPKPVAEPSSKPAPMALANVTPKEPPQDKVQKPPAKPEPPQAKTRKSPQKAAAKTSPKQAPKSAPLAETVFVPAAGEVSTGRALLRTLEHGQGPVIEIAWPDDRSQHGRLFQYMTACLGMRVALMDGQSHLFIAEGTSGSVWDINMDRYSGFLRQPAGWLSPSEKNAEHAIRKHHDLKSEATGVRIFPRRVDAALLGGLRKYIGEGYGQAKSIRARYQFAGNAVIVDGLIVDGHPVAGRIGLSSRTARCAWRS